MSDDDTGDMPEQDFKLIESSFKTKQVVAPCPACGAEFSTRGTLSNYVSLSFSASNEEDTDEAAASFAASICRSCGHVWLFHADTLTSE